MLLPARKSIKGLLASLVDSSVSPSLVFVGREDALNELLATSRAANNPLGIRLARLLIVKEHERAQGPTFVPDLAPYSVPARAVK